MFQRVGCCWTMLRVLQPRSMIRSYNMCRWFMCGLDLTFTAWLKVPNWKSQNRDRVTDLPRNQRSGETSWKKKERLASTVAPRCPQLSIYNNNMDLFTTIIQMGHHFGTTCCSTHTHKPSYKHTLTPPAQGRGESCQTRPLVMTRWREYKWANAF